MTAVMRSFPLLTLIAVEMDRELARFVQFLKNQNKLLCQQAGREIPTRPEERQRRIEFGNVLRRGIGIGPGLPVRFPHQHVTSGEHGALMQAVILLLAVNLHVPQFPTLAESGLGSCGMLGS